MTEWLAFFERTVIWLLWVGIALAVMAFSAVVIERLAYGYGIYRAGRLRRRYVPLIERAVAGDPAAERELLASPRRHRPPIARLLIHPLLDDHDQQRIANSRRLADALSLPTIADRLLQSPWWWRRARALRALGILQYRNYTATIVGALDDPNQDVRSAALDALTDLKDPRSLPAIIARMHDLTLYRGRRAEAVAAFGPECEPLVLDLAELDRENRLAYALVLARVGTPRARPTLVRWATDERVEVREAAFEGLARVGLDEETARLSISVLDRDDVRIRAMAARALRHWNTPEAATQLGRHLDDEWPVAVQAAQSLRTMQSAGLPVLHQHAARTDLAGLLARQMLWEASMPC